MANIIVTDEFGEKHRATYTQQLVPCIKCSMYEVCMPYHEEELRICKEFMIKDKHIHFEKV